MEKLWLMIWVHCWIIKIQVLIIQPFEVTSWTVRLQVLLWQNGSKIASVPIQLKILPLALILVSSWLILEISWDCSGEINIHVLRFCLCLCVPFCVAVTRRIHGSGFRSSTNDGILHWFSWMCQYLTAISKSVLLLTCWQTTCKGSCQSYCQSELQRYCEMNAGEEGWSSCHIVKWFWIFQRSNLWAFWCLLLVTQFNKLIKELELPLCQSLNGAAVPFFAGRGLCWSWRYLVRYLSMLGPDMAELLLTKSCPGGRCLWKDVHIFPRNVRGVFETAFQSHSDSRLLEITRKTWSFIWHQEVPQVVAHRKILQTIDWHIWKPESSHTKNIWYTDTT